VNNAAANPASRRLDLIGRTLSHYRITAAIGAGACQSRSQNGIVKSGRSI
jgi:hypothetical protein